MCNADCKLCVLNKMKFFNIHKLKCFCLLSACRKAHNSKAFTIDPFTVVGLVTWPLNGSEAGGDLVLIQTSMLLLCKSSCSYAN